MDLAATIKKFVDTVLDKPRDDSATVVVSSEIATVSSVAHGLVAGAKFIITYSNINFFTGGVRVGVKIVATVPTVDTFTFAAAGIDDGSGTLKYCSVKLIQYFQKASSPPKPYATVKIPIQTGRGFPISEAVDQGGGQVNQLMAKPKTGECEVIFYSNELSGEFTAQNLAEYFETALGFDRSRQFQIDNGFGVLQIRPARDITLELGDLIEHRQVVEFSINYVHELTESNVGYFDHAAITTTIED